MDAESDEELKETDERMEPLAKSRSPSEDEGSNEERAVTFQARRGGDSPSIFDFAGPPDRINRTAASDINAEFCPCSISFLTCRQIFQVITDESNRFFHRYTYVIQKCMKHFSITTCDYDPRNTGAVRKGSVHLEYLENRSRGQKTLLRILATVTLPWGQSVGSETLLTDLVNCANVAFTNLLTFNGDFSFGNSQKSQGAKSGL